MTEAAPDQTSRYASIGVRWLTPETTHIFEGTYSLMHCTVKNDNVYRGVFAVRLFPVSYPDRFISLRYTDSQEQVQEIGVIEKLATFPAEQQELVRENLRKYYYEQRISRVYDVKEEYGMLLFDVETQRGREQFIMPWRYDRAEEYSTGGKLLRDAFDNRWIVEDVSALPVADRRRFRNYVYW